jgi:predicted transcriptional regulator
MFKDEILENESRRKIHRAIEANPGIHLRELQRILNIPLATLEYHLSYMVRKRIIFGEADGHYRRYYTSPLELEDKKLLAALRQRRMREIVLVILTNKKAKYQFLSDHFKLPHSTLSSYLKHLVDNKILEREKIGYDNLCTIRDEDRVARVLVAYKPSFSDKLVDSVLDAFVETRLRKEKGNHQ